MPTLHFGVRSALAGTAAALVLLAGCGGDGAGAGDPTGGRTGAQTGGRTGAQTGAQDPSSASASPTTTSSGDAASSSAEPGGGDGDTAAFCAVADSDELDALFEQTPPDQYAGALRQAVAVFGGIDPPEEIGADWQALRGGFQQLADALVSVDISTPEGAAALEQATADLGPAVNDAADRVDAYVAANCPEA